MSEHTLVFGACSLACFLLALFLAWAGWEHRAWSPHPVTAFVFIWAGWLAFLAWLIWQARGE